MKFTKQWMTVKYKLQNRAETPKKKEIYNVILHNQEIKYIMQWVMYALNTDNR